MQKSWMLLRLIKQQLATVKNPLAMHKITQAAFIAKKKRVFSTKSSRILEEAQHASLHESLSEILVLLKTSGFFQLMLLKMKFQSRYFPLKELYYKLSFLNNTWERGRKKIRILAADETKEISGVITYTATNRTSALRWESSCAKWSVRFLNSFSYPLKTILIY